MMVLGESGGLRRNVVARSRNKVQLSNGELELTSMLWNEGPVSLSEAHEAFGKYGRPIAYQTMQTRLNRLVEKGIAAKSDDRPTRYRATISKDRVAKGYLDRFLHKVADVSVAPLVCLLISRGSLTQQEIDEIRETLDEIQHPERSERGV